MSETTSLADRSQDGDSEHIEFGDDGEMVEEIVRYIHNCCIVHVANGALMHTIHICMFTGNRSTVRDTTQLFSRIQVCGGQHRQRHENSGVLLHYFHGYAVRDRVSLSLLSDQPPPCTNPDSSLFIPSDSDVTSLTEEMTILFARYKSPNA